jgi:Kef-type K+ transport system membrane component KefB
VHAEILPQIAVAIVFATLFAVLARFLRQPVILGYILAGIVLGESEGLGLISTGQVEPISELGLILLLFMIGLEIDLKKLREAGRAIVSAGVGQFLVCVALGLGFFPLIGFGFDEGSLAPIYLAVAAALSSTTIVVKLLYDKFELDTSTGRLTLGILVFQDIWAILFLAVQPELRDPSPVTLLASLAKGAGVVAFALLMSRFALPVLFRSIAKVPELLVLGALAWCFGIVLLSSRLGLSVEMGALIAGIALSTFPYNLDVIAKVVSLRDFFITLFFVSLGTRIPRPDAEMLTLAAITSGFLIASRFLSITPLLRLAGADNRLAFVPAINLAQISEFSLVICTLGVRLGHVDGTVLGVVVLTLVMTSVLSTYGITYNHEIVRAMHPWLARLGLRDPDPHATDEEGEEARPIVFLGFARQASSLLEEILRVRPEIADRISVIDFNPAVAEELRRRGVHTIYGDVSHVDTLHHAHVPKARVVVSTIPDAVLKGTSNLRLLRHVRAMAPEARMIATADVLEGARELYAEGAAHVLVPRLAGARELSPAVLEAFDSVCGGDETPATAPSGNGTRKAPRRDSGARAALRDALLAREEVLP